MQVPRHYAGTNTLCRYFCLMQYLDIIQVPLPCAGTNTLCRYLCLMQYLDIIQVPLPYAGTYTLCRYFCLMQYLYLVQVPTTVLKTKNPLLRLKYVLTCKNSCKSAVVQGGEPESHEAEKDLEPQGEGDSIV